MKPVRQRSGPGVFYCHLQAFCLSERMAGVVVTVYLSQSGISLPLARGWQAGNAVAKVNVCAVY